jgi:hypothetical protein
VLPGDERGFLGVSAMPDKTRLVIPQSLHFITSE